MGPKPGLEWPLTLDVPALMASGWQPIPFRQFVVKIHSRCDLACDYCYMYEMADQSWRGRPRRMSAEIAESAAMRIGEHARAHALPGVALILHGGEPLLAGPDLISHIVEATRKAAGPDVQVDVRIQTNGVGLDESYLRLFCELGIRVGVSLDGDIEAHNRHRRFPSGRGSYAAVSAGVHRLMQAPFRHLFAGLLCTIDLRNDPMATYEALASFNPPRIDFLLPHGTWAAPPPARVPGAIETPYADWLITIFDQWYRSPATSVRLFEDIMHLILGAASSAEAVGLAPSRMIVIETDGAIEQADTLKATYSGAASHLFRCGKYRAPRRARPVRRGNASARDGGQAARRASSVRRMPGLRHPEGLRWRAICTPISSRYWFRQSFGLLPGPDTPYRPHTHDHASRYQ